MKRLLSLIFLILPTVGFCQWTQVATANQTVQTNTLSGATYLRYGSATDNKWFYKAYTAGKTFVVGSAEYTSNPDPNADPATFVLEAFQLPISSNVQQQTIVVAGKVIKIPATTVTGTTTPPITVPPNQNTAVHFTISATCDGTVVGVTCK